MEKKPFDLKAYSSPLFLIVSVALAYFLTARLGLLLALPPGIVTPVWPPSGVALAALLLFGYHLWPGVLLGSFFANSWPFSTHFFNSLPLNLAIGLGASLQAVTGAYLLKKLNLDKTLFKTYISVFIFFIVALLSCLINPIVGVSSLYLVGIVQEESVLKNFTTWWLGDAAGVYVITPLLVIWSQSSNFFRTFQRKLEALLLISVTIFTGMTGFGWWWLKKGYPLEYTLIPCLLWAIFRFGPQMATLTLTLVASIAIWGTAHGYGPFVQATLNESLLLLQTFIGTVTAITLTLIAVLNELQQVNQLLEQNNRDLERKVIQRTAQLQEQNDALEQTLSRLKFLQNRIITQERLSSLGALTTGIAQQLRNPLNFVINFSDLNVDLISQLKEWLNNEQLALDADQFNQAFSLVNTLMVNIEKVYQHGKSANEIVEKMVTHAQGRVGQLEMTEINALIEEFTNLTYHSLRVRNEYFNVKIEKNFDPTLGKIEVIPQFVSRAFVNILNNAFYSVYQKKMELGMAFTPLICIRTEDREDRVAIVIWDNGNGIPSSIRDQLFAPFFTTKPDEGIGFGLSISKDLIQQNQGEIKVESVEGEYAEFTLLLPKKLYL